MATANLTDLESGIGIPNTGQILRVSPDGTVTTVVTAIDDPVEMSFMEDRCFILAASGLYEVTTQ